MCVCSEQVSIDRQGVQRRVYTHKLNWSFSSPSKKSKEVSGKGKKVFKEVDRY